MYKFPEQNRLLILHRSFRKQGVQELADLQRQKQVAISCGSMARWVRLSVIVWSSKHIHWSWVWLTFRCNGLSLIGWPEELYALRWVVFDKFKTSSGSYLLPWLKKTISLLLDVWKLLFLNLPFDPLSTKAAKEIKDCPDFHDCYWCILKIMF